MIQVRTFSSTNNYALEKELNQWLAQQESDSINRIKYSVSTYKGLTIYSSMVTYGTIEAVKYNA